MAVDIQSLDFIAPVVMCVDPVDKERAIEMAAAYRPSCLSEAKQDEAQLLYAAWLLYGRMQQEQTGVILAGVKSEKEGDLARTYGTAEETADPLGFYARWKALNDICGRGAILASNWRHQCCC